MAEKINAAQAAEDKNFMDYVNNLAKCGTIGRLAYAAHNGHSMESAIKGCKTGAWMRNPENR